MCPQVSTTTSGALTRSRLTPGCRGVSFNACLYCFSYEPRSCERSGWEPFHAMANTMPDGETYSRTTVERESISCTVKEAQKLAARFIAESAFLSDSTELAGPPKVA